MYCLNNHLWRLNAFGLLALLFLFSGCNSSVPEDQIIARVENSVLTRDQLNKRMHWDGVRSDQEMEYVERWVDTELLYTAAREDGFRENEQLEWEIKRLKQQFLINQYLEKAYSRDIQITNEEVSMYYEQNKTDFLVDEREVRIQHILTSSREEARLALQEIQAGKPFEKVVQERSIDEFRAYKGEVGYIEKEDVIPEVAKFAFSSRSTPGRVSGIISSDFGFHIVKVLDKRQDGDLKSLAEVDGEIRRRLRVKKEGDLYYDILFKLRNQSKYMVANPYASATVGNE